MKKTISKTGSVLRNLRLQENLTQEEFAFLAGLSQGEISKLENGTLPFSEGIVVRISKALKTDRAELEKLLLNMPGHDANYNLLKVPVSKSDEASMLLNYAIKLLNAPEEKQQVIFKEFLKEFNGFVKRKENFKSFLEG